MVSSSCMGQAIPKLISSVRAQHLCGIYTIRDNSDALRESDLHLFGPGAFVRIDPETKRFEEVTDVDAPWEDFAFDVPYEDSMLNWAWLPVSRMVWTGNPRIDRGLALLRFVTEGMRSIRDHRTDPRSGWLLDDSMPRPGVVFIEATDEGVWSTRVAQDGLSDDPSNPFPLSWFGQLFCIVPLLRETCRELLTIVPGAGSLGTIAARETHFLLWDDRQLSDLEYAQGELLQATETGIVPATRSRARRSCVVIDLGNHTLTLDGRHLDLTVDAVRALAEVTNGRGQYVDARRIREATSISRPDKLIKALPSELRRLIKTKAGAGGGTRIRTALTDWDVIGPNSFH